MNWWHLFTVVGGAMLTLYLLGWRVESRPVPKPKPVDPWASLDAMLAQTGHDYAVEHLVPASVRSRFTPAGQPCPGRGSAPHQWRIDTNIVANGNGERVRIIQDWRCDLCNARTHDRALVDEARAEEMFSDRERRRVWTRAALEGGAIPALIAEQPLTLEQGWDILSSPQGITPDARRRP